MRSLLPFLLFLAICGCPAPTPTTPLGPDASDASSKVDAMDGDLGTQVCNHLTAIGCPQPVTCPTTLNTKQGVFTDFKPACLLNASSVAEANACGTIHCGN
jgi:hypothetical protein